VSHHVPLAAHVQRPTRQLRISAKLLFAGAGGHVDAQTLHAGAAPAGDRLSLATVQNAVRECEKAGPPHTAAVRNERIRDDIDTGVHRHFRIAAGNRVTGIPESSAIAPPASCRVRPIDTVVPTRTVPLEGAAEE